MPTASPDPDRTGGYDPPAPAAPAERFAPGALLASRYRIVAPLGKGGMGEVYRADDLTLAQPVALKFLPLHIATDPDRLARFRKEVAAARKVSHPNVCRVYDIVEHEGGSFLTMEFVDGEDLSSVLKRLGRVPEEKGVEIARQLCSALAAVHDQELLHRDLKPANVMLDGRGKVRLADFGLAATAQELSLDDVRSGTPLYQAPEQLSGKEVTIRSDLYALGLVLYELFTGKCAFAGTDRNTPASKLSSHVSGLNPTVEAIILKCLEADPENRPRSANEVLVGLPGGDPLAAALAAGQTPSPRMVADAGEAGSLPPHVGLVLLALALAGLLVSAWTNDHVALFRQAPQELSPRELSVRARQQLQQLGYTAPPADTAHALAADEPLLRHLREKHPEQLNRAALKARQLPVVYFWYRQSPQSLAQRLAANDTSGWSMPGRVLPNEPPLREPGMTCIFLDLEGRLLELHAVPPRTPPDEAPREPDWKALLAAAGLKEVLLRKAEPGRVPPMFADQQMAWEGHHPANPDLPIRVEAAFYRGRPVYFHVGPPGSSERMPKFMPENLGEKRQEVLNMILGLIALPVGGWFAWKNWKLRRANPLGASLVAATFVAMGVLGWALAAKHVANPADELAMFTGVLGRASFDGLLLWLAYLALEPWVRRTSPWRLVGWNRLLEGKWRDPLVGRDVLVAVLAASVFVAFLQLALLLPEQLGQPKDYRGIWNATLTEGVGGLLVTAQIGIMVALRHFFMFYLVLLVVRRHWLAVVLTVVIWTALYQHSGEYEPLRWAVGAVFTLLGLLMLLRVGPLAFVVFEVAFEVLVYMPVTTDLSAWYAGISTLSLAFLIGLAVYGFLATTAGKSFRPREADR